jgi:hypothetical protein
MRRSRRTCPPPRDPRPPAVGIRGGGRRPHADPSGWAPPLACAGAVAWQWAARLTGGMHDSEIIHRIGELAEEERLLEEAHATTAEGLSTSERERLDELAVTLDRLWDLLRQRRALRNAGRDPDEAEERPAETVERYQQ